MLTVLEATVIVYVQLSPHNLLCAIVVNQSSANLGKSLGSSSIFLGAGSAIANAAGLAAVALVSGLALP